MILTPAQIAEIRARQDAAHRARQAARFADQNGAWITGGQFWTADASAADVPALLAHIAEQEKRIAGLDDCLGYVVDYCASMGDDAMDSYRDNRL